MKKLLVLLLTATLLISCVWLTASAAATDYVDAEGNPLTADATAVTATTTEWTDEWYVVNSSVTIATRIEVKGNVNLILADGATLTAGKGVHVPAGSTLTIWCQSGKSGALEATGGENLAGIGGNDGEGNGPIAINGGTVRANGGDKAAGIGGGRNADGAKITIRGGNVTARGSAGGDDGAGIGGGVYGAGKEITISGGTVNASSPKGGSGIGGGAYAKGADITISGGTVIATSGQYGAGIGGGYEGGAENITISGGDVKASGGYRTEYMSYSSGIGAGAYWNNVIGSATNIIITGGIVEAQSGNTGGYAIGATPEFNGYSHLTYGKRSNTQSINVVEYTGNPQSDWNGWSWVKIVPATFAFEMTMTPATVELNGTATATSTGAVGATATLSDGAKVVLSSTSATWSVAPDGNGSTISSAGVLTVAADERAETLTVSAVVDGTTYTATVTVVQPDVTVTFDSDGGSAVSAQTVTRYQKATKPDNPARDGYAFDGWYTQAEGGDKWDFTAEVTADMTLYAHWTENTIEGIELDKTALTLQEGETATLTATVTPADAKDAAVTWTVTPEDGSVVTITENDDGTINITATGAGTATITATAGGLTATCTVTVSGPEVEEPTPTLTLDKTALTLQEGDTATLTATVTPADATVTWTVTPEDGSVVTIAALTRGLPVTGGAVTVAAVKAGTATITASAGDLTATCTVTVLPAAQNEPDPVPETYTITLDANGGQIVAGTLQTGPDGKLTSLPTAARDGYVFDGWYTAREGGAPVTTATVFTADMIIYAHWTAVPQTGDNTPLGLYMMLLAMAVGGLLAVKARR